DDSHQPIGKIVWHKCPEEHPPPFQCGRMKAPLDYTNSSDPRTASIAVLKFPAGGQRQGSNKPMGTILLNPGGPGGSGVDFLARRTSETTRMANDLDKIMKGKYDLLSFDPRGIARTTPRADCWNDEVANDYVNALEFEAMGLPHSRVGPNHLDSAAGLELARLDFAAKLCYRNETVTELMRYMGTTFVARDMRLLSKASGDSDGLNYWGFSYGTVLGSVFADMFPDEVHRLVIDGVVDVPNYLNGSWYDDLIDTDNVLYGFYEECAKSPQGCALARKAEDGSRKLQARDIRAKVTDFLEELKIDPVPVVDARIPGLVTYSLVVEALFQALYRPKGWDQLAEALEPLISERNGTLFLESYGDAPLNTHPPSPSSDQAQIAIACGDAKLEVPDKRWTIDGFKSFLSGLEEQSSLFGQLWVSIGAECLGFWRPRSVERHYGDFTSKTSFPLVMIGNDYDPVTPAAYADLMAEKFPNAVSVRRAGYGHCSMSQPSKCINQVVTDYFLEGKVPREGVRCELDDVPLFKDKRQVSAGGLLHQSSSAAPTDEELAWQHLGDAIFDFNARR
ncbi:alpha/beta-hydrolase, partial [Violaceomyces palustris]